jgi:uncharacterized protein YjiS (DUF1127 family)
MHSTTFAPHAHAHAALHAAEPRPGMLARLAAAIRRRREEAMAIEALAEFDDRTLRDLGLARGAIPQAVRHGRNDG